MEQNNNQPQIINLSRISKTLWQKRRTFLKVWIWTFVLSCIWILPQPRYYMSEVKLAPEVNGEQGFGGLSNIASSFGINMGGTSGQDAIYPELYPELFKNPEFIVGLYGIHVITKEGNISTNYFTYMKKHQKKNILTWPFNFVRRKIKALFAKEDKTPIADGADEINPFMMNRKDYDLMLKIMSQIKCSIDKRTSVTTISVKDQDPLVCAIMSDSIKQHLQKFIIQYRTSKAIEDVAHFQHMRDSAEYDYNIAMNRYSRFCDTHRDVILQTYQSQRDKLESELTLKQNSLSAMETQLQSAKLKLQEKTPAFTTLKSATVPVKPAGPKRVIFVIGMMMLVSIGLTIYILSRGDVTSV